jgi:uncharacterized Fe-S center protein
MSKVYFTDFRTNPKADILTKLRRLLLKAGFDELDLEKKMTAIKIHFGEPGNMAFLRPNYASVVAKMVKEKGGYPFLTDANTLYKGRRSNAVDHLQTAMENGFNVITTGCNVIIADGLRGTEYREIEINQKYCKTAKIGSAIADADVVIAMSHFKGHEMSGFGGCLKNIGMGSGAIGGKLEMHSDSKPEIAVQNCTACKVCERNCAHDAIHIVDKKAQIDYSKCVGCGQCVSVCMFDAAQVHLDAKKMQEKMAEYALAVLKNKTSFHINFLMDISPNCDCWNFNDAALVPNIGILVSADPVAIDQASVDMVNQAPINFNCGIAGHNHSEDRFTSAHPNTDWRACLQHAEEIGLGSRKYELIKME